MAQKQGPALWDDPTQVLGTIPPSYDASFDIGTPSMRFRNLYLSGAIIGPVLTQRLYSDLTQVAEAGVPPTVAGTYSVPANTLMTDGDTLIVNALATTASNGNNKTMTLTFGGITLSAASTTVPGSPLNIEARVYRSGTNLIKAVVRVNFQATTTLNYVAETALTLTAAQTVLLTITAPSNGDITKEVFTVDKIAAGV